MNIGKRAVSMATALVLGAAIVGLTVEPAAAEKKKTSKDDVTCSLTGSTLDPPTENDHEFFKPGEYASVKKPNGDGALLECQNDGTWKAVRQVGQPRVPGQVPPHTFTPTP